MHAFALRTRLSYRPATYTHSHAFRKDAVAGRAGQGVDFWPAPHGRVRFTRKTLGHNGFMGSGLRTGWIPPPTGDTDDDLADSTQHPTERTCRSPTCHGRRTGQISLIACRCRADRGPHTAQAMVLHMGTGTRGQQEQLPGKPHRHRTVNACDVLVPRGHQPARSTPNQQEQVAVWNSTRRAPAKAETAVASASSPSTRDVDVLAVSPGLDASLGRADGGAVPSDVALAYAIALR